MSNLLSFEKESRQRKLAENWFVREVIGEAFEKESKQRKLPKKLICTYNVKSDFF
ncbi:MAG: hypothetical protein J6U86_03860 [Clostridia bacterium]|nr:hypothetical protein [Clostridia bacterium]